MAQTGAGFAPGRHAIEGIGRGGFLFAGMSHIGSILALPSGVHAWPVTTVAAITTDALDAVLAEAGSIGFLLIGTGDRFHPLPAQIQQRLREAGLTFEAMSTSSATQTYNILLDEGRAVAAALIAIK